MSGFTALIWSYAGKSAIKAVLVSAGPENRQPQRVWEELAGQHHAQSGPEEASVHQGPLALRRHMFLLLHVQRGQKGEPSREEPSSTATRDRHLILPSFMTVSWAT